MHLDSPASCWKAPWILAQTAPESSRDEKGFAAQYEFAFWGLKNSTKDSENLHPPPLLHFTAQGRRSPLVLFKEGDEPKSGKIWKMGTCRPKNK